jgi:hypothetical protein
MVMFRRCGVSAGARWNVPVSHLAAYIPVDSRKDLGQHSCPSDLSASISVSLLSLQFGKIVTF